MKVHIMGNRRAFRPESFDGLDRDQAKARMERANAWLGIDLEMDHLPEVGEKITLDGGSGYIVTDRHWYVNTEVRNTAEWTLDGDVKGPGYIETVHVTVRPEEDADQPKWPEEYRKEGRQEIVKALMSLIDENPTSSDEVILALMKLRMKLMSE